jgi:hypothetical protein
VRHRTKLKPGVRLLGINADTDREAFVKTTAPITELVKQTLTATATLALMVNQSGLDLIAPYVLAQKISPGLVTLITLMIYILKPSALIKVFAIELLVLATVSLVMKVSLANVLSAQTIVMTEEAAGQKNSWLPRLAVLTNNHGML